MEHGEGYPDDWKHCLIHLHPDTGEMHSDGDHTVREWIQNKLKGRTDKANLGLATNADLIDELRVRIEIHGNLEYKTVGDTPFCFCNEPRSL